MSSPPLPETSSRRCMRDSTAPQETAMLAKCNEGQAIDRRRFVQTFLLPAALPIAAALTSATTAAEQAAAAGAAGPDIIDCNVHLFDWPFRTLKYARTEALAAKLPQHRITKAWAGNFEAGVHPPGAPGQPGPG